jgi:hypothetical protein
VNPGVAMLDVVGNTEPGGMGGINSLLRDMRGDGRMIGDGGVECVGDVCRPIDEVGNAADAAGATSGYWWPRIAITFVVVSTVVTLVSMRLVVPAGMRWAFRRTAARALLPPPPAPAVTVGDDANTTIEELDPDAQADEARS